MAVVNSNMITKTVCKIEQYILCLLFSPSEFIEAVLVAFAITISTTYVILSHAICELSTILFKYLPFSQEHMVRFQL